MIASSCGNAVGQRQSSSERLCRCLQTISWATRPVEIEESRLWLPHSIGSRLSQASHATISTSTDSVPNRGHYYFVCRNTALFSRKTGARRAHGSHRHRYRKTPVILDRCNGGWRARMRTVACLSPGVDPRPSVSRSRQRYRCGGRKLPVSKLDGSLRSRRKRSLQVPP